MDKSCFLEQASKAGGGLRSSFLLSFAPFQRRQRSHPMHSLDDKMESDVELEDH